VLLTTHQIEEAATVADRVVVLHQGILIASGSPAALTAQLPDRTITARTALRASELRAMPDVLDVTVADGRMRAASARPEATVRALLAADPTLDELRAVFLPMAIAGGLWMPLEALPACVQDLAVWLPTYHMSQLGLGLLVGESIVDNVAALLAATAVTASLATIAYRSMRA
jgi:hypothetical protein